MYYLCITVRTDESHPDHDSVDQAYVSCWMDRETEEQAIEDAKNFITQDPWIVEHVDSIDQVSADDFEDDPDGLKHFEQAKVDKNVLVFHVCPKHTTYFVQFDVSQPEVDESGNPTGQTAHADATVWVAIEPVIRHEDDPDEVDVMDPDFWSETRIEVVMEIAQSVVDKEGWHVEETVKHWPFSYRHLDEQPDLAEYVDNAEEVGVSLVIWDRSES